PAGTPKEVVALLNREIVKILATPEMKERQGALGNDVVASSPEEFGERIKAELSTWAKVMKAANIKAGCRALPFPFSRPACARVFARLPLRGFGRRVMSGPSLQAVRRCDLHTGGAWFGNRKEYAMRRRSGIVGITARTAIAGASFAALAVAAQAAEYKMTVNRARLINPANEPQNWLMMNGDYGSTRYSKLAQINRDNVKNLRMVWAMALRGMQDIGQNGPENEVNPLIDNGFMYTSDG